MLTHLHSASSLGVPLTMPWVTVDATNRCEFVELEQGNSKERDTLNSGKAFEPPKCRTQGRWQQLTFGKGQLLARPKLIPGQLGTVSFSRESDGRVNGRARTRGLNGKNIYLRVRGWSEETVVHDLLRKAGRESDSLAPKLTADSTFADAHKWCELEHKFGDGAGWTLSRDELQTLTEFVAPKFRELTLGEVTSAKIEQLLSAVVVAHGHTAARHARAALSRLLGEAVTFGALASNPIRKVERLPARKKLGMVLTPEQFEIVGGLLRKWKSPSGRVEDVPELEDAIEIMRGTALSISDVLRLRRENVNIDLPAPVIRLPRDANLDSPAGSNGIDPESMSIAISYSTVRAVERRLEHCGGEVDELLFRTMTGGPYSSGRFQRLLQAFVQDHHDVLEAIEVEVNRFSSVMFRNIPETSSRLGCRRTGPLK